MDEFGKPKPASNSTPDVLEEVDPNKLLGLETEEQKIEYSVAHDNIRVPVKPPPSPAPFSHYAPTTTNHLSYPINDSRNEEQLAVEQDEKGAGCCKCVVM
jgi:serine/arginine repetitive matrix protein 1